MNAAEPQLPPNQQRLADGKWPIVGERSPASVGEEWPVVIAPEDSPPVELTLAELRSLPRVARSIDIHCVTRWTKLGARFAGVRLADVLRLVEPFGEAQFVSFVAHSSRGHSTSLPLGIGMLMPSATKNKVTKKSRRFAILAATS